MSDSNVVESCGLIIWAVCESFSLLAAVSCVTLYRRIDVQFLRLSMSSNIQNTTNITLIVSVLDKLRV